MYPTVRFILLCILQVFAHEVIARDIHVSLEGSDGNPGTLEAPFLTFKRALMDLKGGDRLVIHDGRYVEPLELTGLEDVEVVPLNANSVILDGSDPLSELSWKAYRGGIYQARLKAPIWQLFCDDAMMTAARWPNAHMTDRNFFNLKDNWRATEHGEASPFGTIKDTEPDPEGRRSVYPQTPGTNKKSLADTGINMTGAVAILNIGSWMSYVSRRTHHETGSSVYNYDTTFSESGELSEKAQELAPGKRFHRVYQSKWHSHYYMIEGLQCLDVPREYWYDKDSGYLYFYSPDGRNPQKSRLRGKRRNYMLSLDTCQNVKVRGINLFAGAFRMKNCDGCTIQDAELKYPSYNKIQIGNFDLMPISTISDPGNPVAGKPSNSVINCRFSFFDGEALDASHALIENCLFHDFQYTCLDFAVALRPGDNSIIRHCTVYRCGASEGFRGSKTSNIMEYCRIYDYGGLQHDGSSFQAGGSGKFIYFRNWAHDNPKNGYRLDSGNDPEEPNAYGQLIQNVAWNVDRGCQIKGDDHLIANNLYLDAELELNTQERWKSTNYRTLVYNNLADEVNDRGIKRSNYFGNDYRRFLRDPDNLDFRPVKGSPLDGAGAGISVANLPQGFPPEWFDDSLFTSPLSIGPYEAEPEVYWIPGFRSEKASTPIPVDKSTSARKDCDLMWLTGYLADSHDVYFGRSKRDMTEATRKSETFMGNLASPGNVFTPPALLPGNTYYWRVDSVKDGQIIKGDVWEFSIPD